MQALFLGKIPFREALSLESAAFTRVAAGGSSEILGFETGPVITLGVRGTDSDLNWSAEEIRQRGFEVHRLARGGQATLHNPGQLVIFPIANVRSLGARAWVQFLLSVTEAALRELGKETRCRPGQPGLYSDEGKVAALGLRMRDGISTHGLSINVANDLADFEGIRPCGVAKAKVDRLGPLFLLEDVFAVWLRNFKHGLTSAADLTNLECSSSDVRL